MLPAAAPLALLPAALEQSGCACGKCGSAEHLLQLALITLGLGVGMRLLLQLLGPEDADANMDPRRLPVAAGVTGVKAGEGGMPLVLHELLLPPSMDARDLLPLLLTGGRGLVSCMHQATTTWQSDGCCFLRAVCLQAAWHSQ